MYFLTEQDPDYVIKGSRDPLGFQALWQSVGRKLIPALSTVSSSIIDFQLLSFATYLKNELRMDELRYRKFLLRFEKVMAVVRFKLDSSKSFNGIDKIRKLVNSNADLLIIDDDPILVNQRAYGIWGKYNRPFTDSQVENHSCFKKIQEEKFINNPELQKLVSDLLKDGEMQVKIKDYRRFYDLITITTSEERKLYREPLLRDNVSNSLLHVLDAHPDLSYHQGLYPFISAVKDKTDSQQLAHVLDVIKRTEQILCPLNRIFRHLQTKSIWDKKSLVSEQRIIDLQNQIRIDIANLDTEIQLLYAILKSPTLDMVRKLVEKNIEITGRRKTLGWMAWEGDTLQVNHQDGRFEIYDFDHESSYDNGYFLSSYQSLYNQLK
nr:hypothetical protein [uncultured Sphingobacterium sp.]